MDRKVGGGKFHYRTGKWEGKLSISIRSFDSYAYIFSLKSLDLLNIFCFHTKMQLFLKFTPAKVGFYVPTPWHLPCTIIGIGWLFSAFTLFLYVITSCLTDLGGCRIVLRLNSVLFRLSVLQGCSPSLQRPWPTGGDCRIVLRLYSVLDRLGDCRIVPSLYVALFRLGGLQDCSRSINTRSMNKKNIFKKWWFLFYMFKKLISN